MIASNYTQTRRPKVTLLTHKLDNSGRRKPPSIPDPIPDNVVIKRTHSETGRHVYFPSDDNAKKQNALREKVDIHDAMWFMQSFTPFLKQGGEIRMFFAGMKYIYSMLTVKNETGGDSDWRFDPVETVTPLHLLE